MNTATCGQLYLQALERYTGFDDAKIALFAPGFVMGHAECLYLGAKRAAMFRPSLQYHEIVIDACKAAMEIYDDLALLFIAETGEFWLYRTEWHEMMMRVYTMAKEDQSVWNLERWSIWHLTRGRLCGIPENEIDIVYHEREGHTIPADRLRR